jgi:hypothetical protein
VLALGLNWRAGDCLRAGRRAVALHFRPPRLAVPPHFQVNVVLRAVPSHVRATAVQVPRKQ